MDWESKCYKFERELNITRREVRELAADNERLKRERDSLKEDWDEMQSTPKGVGVENKFCKCVNCGHIGFCVERVERLEAEQARDEWRNKFQAVVDAARWTLPIEDIQIGYLVKDIKDAKGTLQVLKEVQKERDELKKQLEGEVPSVPFAQKSREMIAELQGLLKFKETTERRLEVLFEHAHDHSDTDAVGATFVQDPE